MSTGQLIIQLGIAAYILFTLLPDSSTQMVSFPWVMLWQVGLLCFAIAALLNLWRLGKPFYLLGNGLDWVIGSSFVTLCLSTMFSQFPSQAMWYSLIAFGYFIALYTTNNFLHTKPPKPRLGTSKDVQGTDSRILPILKFQGLLGIAVIITSLFLWTTQTWLPQLGTLAKLNQWGLNLTYDFTNLESRNWAPMGHQNYVAGYLMLVLPIFVSLAIAQKGLWRSLWLGGIGLGILDLYTTSSRGGLLGFGAIALYGMLVALWRSRYKGWVLIGSGGALTLFIGLIVANNRLRSLILGLVANFLKPTQGSGELLFRLIAADVGLRIGLDHWLFGAGAGSVIMLYQKYRPQWAGREAELLFQLHSTPMHLWAELGIGAIITSLLLIFTLVILFIKLHRSVTWRKNTQEQAITYGLFGSLLGYGVLALTDYQLDVPAISGTLVVILAALAYLGQMNTGQLITLGYHKQPRLWLSVIATVYLGLAIAWLIPVNMAWQASNVGFIYLSRGREDLIDALKSGKSEMMVEAIAALDQFQDRLKLAQRLAPWEPYYPYQLGWTLADLAVNYSNLPQAQTWQKEGLANIKQSIAINPHNEAGYNAAAWLSLQQNTPDSSQEAEKYFRRGLELVPQKRSLSFGLGVSLLRQGKIPEAIAAMTNEIINDPSFITSPIWTEAPFQSLYPQVIAGIESTYTQDYTQASNGNLHRAALRWWNGGANAVKELEATGNPTAVLLAKAIANDRNALQTVSQNPQTPLEMVIAAWLNPNLRDKLLERAYIFASRTLPDERTAVIVKTMSDRMANATSFDSWLRQPLPPNSPLILNYRRARLGFGIVSRHTDGVVPVDFFNVRERLEISLFLNSLFS